MRRKLISALLVLCLCACLVMSVSASSDLFVVDDAELLTNSQRENLTERLKEISAQYDVEIVIVTVDTINSTNIDRYAEKLYDNWELGYGESNDGILFLICMDIREFRILSIGAAADAISTSDIDDITDAITEDLSDGEYADAFNTFADMCEEYLYDAVNFDFGGNLIIALIIGIVFALIVTGVMRGQLKSVRRQNQADVYVKQGSMNLTHTGDYFMYHTLTRTPRPKSNSSSRSGSSRNMGGGRF